MRESFLPVRVFARATCPSVTRRYCVKTKKGRGRDKGGQEVGNRHDFFTICMVRYDTIEEINMDSKAEYTA